MLPKPIHVEGKNKGKIMLYALSTCIHCKVTRKLLDELGVEYDYIYVDQLGQDEIEEVLKEIAKFNPIGSFPTMVINNNKWIIGSRLDEIREALK
jgi:glutaredoxin-like protein NrdH